jgi:tRNA nucleotidyltransferase (CCA-adding enzyme)
MKHIEADKILRLTMLFHDIGKPLTKTVNERTGYDSFKGHPEKGAEMAKKIMRRLKFDNDTMKKVCHLVRCHDHDIDHNLEHDIDRALDHTALQYSYIRRSIAQIGEDFYPLYLKVQGADIAAQSDYKRSEKMAYLAAVERIYHNIKENGDCVSLKGLAVTGNDLITLGIPRGKQIGRILKRMLEDVLDCPEHNTREYLLALPHLSREQ